MRRLMLHCINVQESIKTCSNNAWLLDYMSNDPLISEHPWYSKDDVAILYFYFIFLWILFLPFYAIYKIIINIFAKDLKNTHH